MDPLLQLVTEQKSFRYLSYTLRGRPTETFHYIVRAKGLRFFQHFIEMLGLLFHLTLIDRCILYKIILPQRDQHCRFFYCHQYATLIRQRFMMVAKVGRNGRVIKYLP